MSNKDEYALQIIKNVYGGSVKLRSNVNAFRYVLYRKSNLLTLIKNVNGHIRNPKRLKQMELICNKYNLNLIYPNKLIYYNG